MKLGNKAVNVNKSKLNQIIVRPPQPGDYRKISPKVNKIEIKTIVRPPQPSDYRKVSPKVNKIEIKTIVWPPQPGDPRQTIKEEEKKTTTK